MNYEMSSTTLAAVYLNKYLPASSSVWNVINFLIWCKWTLNLCWFLLRRQKSSRRREFRESPKRKLKLWILDGDVSRRSRFRFASKQSRETVDFLITTTVPSFICLRVCINFISNCCSNNTQKAARKRVLSRRSWTSSQTWRLKKLLST